MRIRWEFPAKHHPQWGNHDLLPSDRPHETNISFILVLNLSLKISVNWKPHANLGRVTMPSGETFLQALAIS